MNLKYLIEETHDMLEKVNILIEKLGNKKEYKTATLNRVGGCFFVMGCAPVRVFIKFPKCPQTSCFIYLPLQSCIM